MTTQAHNPMAALLGIRALRGFYALTDADGYVMTVIDYMPHRAAATTYCETAYGAIHEYGAGNPAFGLRDEQPEDTQKAAFAARFLLRGNGKHIKQPERVAAFERIAAVYFFTEFGKNLPSFIDGDRLRDGSWRCAA
jgi:hypothetical protein